MSHQIFISIHLLDDYWWFQSHALNLHCIGYESLSCMPVQPCITGMTYGWLNLFKSLLRNLTRMQFANSYFKEVSISNTYINWYKNKQEIKLNYIHTYIHFTNLLKLKHKKRCSIRQIVARWVITHEVGLSLRELLRVVLRYLASWWSIAGRCARHYGTLRCWFWRSRRPTGS